jgi:hypothetical protein
MGSNRVIKKHVLYPKDMPVLRLCSQRGKDFCGSNEFSRIYILISKKLTSSYAVDIASLNCGDGRALRDALPRMNCGPRKVFLAGGKAKRPAFSAGCRSVAELAV